MVVGNLGKARRCRGRLSQVLGREGADPKVFQAFYNAVTQAVLLFGAETWVLTPRMEKALDSFQSRVARNITGRQPRRGGIDLTKTYINASRTRLSFILPSKK